MYINRTVNTPGLRWFCRERCKCELPIPDPNRNQIRLRCAYGSKDLKEIASDGPAPRPLGRFEHARALTDATRHNLQCSKHHLHWKVVCMRKIILQMCAVRYCERLQKDSAYDPFARDHNVGVDQYSWPPLLTMGNLSHVRHIIFSVVSKQWLSYVKGFLINPHVIGQI